MHTKRLINFFVVVGLMTTTLFWAGPAGAGDPELGDGSGGEADGPAAGSSLTVKQSGIWGGGFINALAPNPYNPDIAGPVLSGSDVGGIHALGNTTDWKWTTANYGIFEGQQLIIATIAHSPNTAKVYAGYGANSGGVIVHDGTQWSALPRIGATQPKFNGKAPTEGPYAACFGTCPRATGRLLVIQEEGTSLQHLYAGTYGQGVMRYDPDTSTWTVIALGENSGQCDPDPEVGCFITSLIPTPTGDGLVAGTKGYGAFLITGQATAAPGAAAVAGITFFPALEHDDAEELVFGGGYLMCACGKDRFYAGTAPYTNLTRYPSGLQFIEDETSWAGIAYQASPSTVFLGAKNAKCDDVDPPNQVLRCHTVYRATLSLPFSWQELTFPMNQADGSLDITVAGTAPAVTWWLATDQSAPRNLINQQDYEVSSMQTVSDVASADGYALLVAGRSGVWRCLKPISTWKCQPAVRDLGVTIINDVVADRDSLGHVHAAATDWGRFMSDDHLDPGKVMRGKDGPPNLPKAFAVAIDQQELSAPRDLYVAAGDPTVPGAGQIYTVTDPPSHSWNSTGWGNGRPVGLAAGRATGDTSARLYAAASAVGAGDGNGLYQRLPGGLLWTKINLGVDAFNSAMLPYAPISYPNGSGPHVYAFDRTRGELWARKSNGAWEIAWTAPLDERSLATGFIAAHPTEAGTLWVTTYKFPLSRIRKFTNCHSGACEQALEEINVANPGPVAVLSSGSVYVATYAGSNTPAKLYRYAGTTWTDIADGNMFYRQAAGAPAQLAVAGTFGYVATVGNGVIVLSSS